MRKFTRVGFLAILVLAAAITRAQEQGQITWKGFDQAKPEVALELKRDVLSGQARIAAFFGSPFEKPFQIWILPHRVDFDGVLKDKWGMPASEKWMVGAGGADTLAILDPAVWKTEAAEHNTDNTKENALLIAHEMVHVYHAQHSPSKDLAGMDDLGWFVEGLATYVSGQLAMTHGGDARKAIAEGVAPKKLADAWSGKYRYGVSGSMVEFIDRTYGRAETARLLVFTRPEEVLGDLKLTEQQFLDAWKAFIGKPKPWDKQPETKNPKPDAKPTVHDVKGP